MILLVLPPPGVAEIGDLSTSAEPTNLTKVVNLVGGRVPLRIHAGGDWSKRPLLRTRDDHPPQPATRRNRDARDIAAELDLFPWDLENFPTCSSDGHQARRALREALRPVA